MQSKVATCLADFLQSCIDRKAHVAGKVLHAHILRTGLCTDTFLSNRLIELYSKCGRLTSARHVFDGMHQKNIYSWHSMMDAYCKSSMLDNAHELFVEIPEKNTVSWNTMISALVRNACQEKALNVYSMMNRKGFRPTHITFASVLSACGGLAYCGCECHGLAIKVGLDNNLYVGNALLGMYTKCGNIGDAIQAFEDLPEANEVSFTALMGGLAQTDRVVDAFEMFRSMHKIGIQIDSVSLSSVLGVCARAENGEMGIMEDTYSFSNNMHGQQIHGLTIKLGFENDHHLNNSLLDMYAKNGDMDSAELIFTNLPHVNVVSWNVMIGGYGKKCETEKALEYMQMMQCWGCDADEVTYINMLAACVKSGDMETGRQIFDQMACPSLSSWNAILSGYSQKEAIELFRKMQFKNVQPDRTTFAIVLSSCAGLGLLEFGKQIHAASLKALLLSDLYVASGLIGMYSKCNKAEVAKFIFDGILDPDIVCWNSMMAGLSVASLDEEAFGFFKQMLTKGKFPTHFSYSTVLSCCAKLSSLSEGRQVHSKIIKHGYISDVFVGSSLIGLYSKCGDTDTARHFFDSMPCKNTVTWNEMVHGFAQSGRGDEAVKLYEEMIQSGEKPDSITFVAVLTACSHAGLVDTGIRILTSMEKDHGVQPLLDHYSCIIDSLSRAGRFQEVEMLLDQIPYKDDPVLWEILLSSCRVHADVGLARRAADELFRIDPRNSAPYVLLANMYSSLGRWDDAKLVREMMIENQVVKDPGFSWVDHKTGMQTFVNDNGSSVDDDFVEAVDETFQYLSQDQRQ